MSIKKLLRLFIFPLLIFAPLACYIEEEIPDFADRDRSGGITVAWWKLDDIEGATAFDSSGHNNHGTVYGARWMDNSLFFNGRDDCVKIPDSTILRPAQITIQAWINPKIISQAVLLEKVPGGVYPPQKGWQIWVDCRQSKTLAWIGNGDKGKTGVTGKTVIRPGRWYHITMTYDGARLNLYVNGRLDASEPNTTGIGDNSAASLTIGYSGYWNHNYFNGLMRDARIYNYARSAGEIQADYNAALKFSAGDSYTHPSPGWSSLAPMPTSRTDFALATARGKIYVIGGVAVGDKHLTANEEYDPAMNKWTTRAPMPSPRGGCTAASVNGRIYVIGGSNNRWTELTVNEEYDPVTDKWTAKAPMPTGRRSLRATAPVVNGKIYVIGGTNNSYKDGNNWGNLNQNEEYDPIEDIWTTKSPMPTRRHSVASVALNNKIYAIGGDVYSCPPDHWETLGVNEEYNPATNKWTAKAPMPTHRRNLALDTIAGKIYAIGGQRSGPNYRTTSLPDNEEYDPIADIWLIKTGLPEPRGGLGAGVINNRAYIIGGDNWGFGIYNNNWLYDPASDR